MECLTHGYAVKLRLLVLAALAKHLGEHLKSRHVLRGGIEAPDVVLGLDAGHHGVALVEPLLLRLRCHGDRDTS
jgi:hypothetical protein